MPQDERYFRQLFSGELLKEEILGGEKKYSYFIHTPFYNIDLNHDGVPEQIVFVKKDSEDWVEIFEQKKGERKKVFAYRFEVKGFDSELFRIQFKKISQHSYAILFYFYEGVSRRTEMQATARIYVGTIDNGDLRTLAVLKGPSFFEEYKSLKGHYHLRNYEVYLKDLNGDETKELVIKFREMSQVYLYNGKGSWKSF